MADVTTPGDFVYLDFLLQQRLIRGEVLEIGSFNYQGENGNARRFIREAGLTWTGTDIEPGPSVDLTVDILDTGAVSRVGRSWDTVLVMNLLEHVYDPITALRNSCSLLAPGGSCVIVGPAVFQLHDYPIDCWRPLPDFFSEFARREGYAYREDLTRWIVEDRLRRISVRDGQKMLPSSFFEGAELYGRSRHFRSRVANRLLNTTGRVVQYGPVGLGLVVSASSPRQV